MKKSINSYVKTIINKTGLDEDSKRELSKEVQSHLEDSRDNYLSIGYSNTESTNRAIDDFKSSEFIKDIREACKFNKQTKFYLSDYLKSILALVFMYPVLVYVFNNININISYTYLYLLSFSITYTLIYVYIKLKTNFTSTLTTIKVLFIIGFTSFLTDLVIDNIMFFARNKATSFTIYFNLKLLICLILSLLIFCTFELYLKNKKYFENISFYNFSLQDFILVFSIIVLNLVYSTIPYKFFLSNMIFSSLNMINKNIFFIKFENNVFVPNLGIFLLILFIFKKFSQSKVK